MNRLIVITGPTASGKSELAVKMAQSLDTDIINADSRQVFKGIPIATAVPSLEERGGVRHHLLEFLPLEAYYSAATFEQDALRVARRIWNSGKKDVILCGGSMMYVDALCNGIDELPTVEESLRRRLTEQWQQEGDEWLTAEALRLDPDYCSRADMKNLKRLFHCVEITLQAGQPYSSLLTGKKKERDFEILKYYIERPREELFDRINRRVEKMVETGLLEEARAHYDRRHLNSLNTVGLKEMFKVIEGEWDLEFAKARMAKNTRVYAKKQMTWFRRDPNAVVWVPYINEHGMPATVCLTTS